MRFFPLLTILGLTACNSTGTPTGAGSTTAGSATGGAGSGTAGATGGATGTTGASGSGGSVAASSTGASPIGLWLGGAAEVSATELMLGGDQKISDSCPPIDPSANPAGVSAFDAQGNLWVQYPSDTNSLYMWTASQLGQACASGMPAVTLTSDWFGQPGEGFSAIAFDSQGNLWCVDPYEGVRNTLVGFRASDLDASGAIEPAWGVLQGGFGSSSDNLQDPSSVAFDSAGNLWVGNVYSVIAYSPSTFAAAVLVDGGISQNSIPADFQITNPSEGSIASFAYRYLAFDTGGDLWVAIENTEDGGVNQIVEYSSAQLAALSGNDEPTPAAVLTAEVANAVVWGPLAFDSSGTLWAGVEGGNPDLYGFSKANLATGSHPDFSVTVPGGAAASLAFDPIPKGLPIQP